MYSGPVHEARSATSTGLSCGCGHALLFALVLFLFLLSFPFMGKRIKPQEKNPCHQANNDAWTSALLLLSGVCNAGELPGHLVAHSGEGGPGQAPLLHPPDVPRQSRFLRRSVRAAGLDRLRDGIHQEVRSCHGCFSFGPPPLACR